MIVPPLQPSLPGDIAFYASHGSLIERAIELRTGSPIIHVAIVSDPSGTTTAATSAGITVQPIGLPATLWRPNVPYDRVRLDAALAGLASEVGQPYGYADILNQVLLLTGKDPILLDKSSDCSDLATKFLWMAGYPLPWAFLRTNTITPGGLFTLLTMNKPY